MPKKGLSHDQMVKLIREVHKRPYIWDTDHEDYNDKFHLSKSWEEISHEMKLPDKGLRRKWKNLRDAYRKESKKEKPSTWKYYNMLCFLKFRNNNDDDNDDDNDMYAADDTSDLGGAESYVKFELPDANEEVYLNEHEDAIPKKRRKRENNDDYDIMFLKSLAPYLKQLDPIRRLVVRSKMQDMLLNEIAAQQSTDKLNMKR